MDGRPNRRSKLSCVFKFRWHIADGALVPTVAFFRLINKSLHQFETHGGVSLSLIFPSPK